MDIHIPEYPGETSLTGRLGAALAAAASQAASSDLDGRFPTAAMIRLRDAGLLAAPLPVVHGGDGIGTDPARAQASYDLLRRIGRASLSLGRVFEGHLNAIRLVLRYGNSAQIERIADDVHAGHLYGLWITDVPGRRVRLDGAVLRGTKGPASASSFATRALVTLDCDGRGEHMALVTVAPSPETAQSPLQGMRATGTGSVVLDGVAATPVDIVGAPDDYMRQPEISLGAWRTLAVIMGGLDALVDAARAELLRRDRHRDPHQLARMGHVAIAHETARLWLARAADLAEAADAGEHAANYVKLARIAVEAACLDAVRLVQRALGMAAFVQPHPVERLSRDLNTYLRQPALDMVLDEAALHFATRPPP